MKNIGLSIKYFREKIYPGHGGQADAAKSLGVSRASWSKYENSQTLSRPTLRNISKVLRVTVDELLAGPPEESSQEPLASRDENKTSAEASRVKEADATKKMSSFPTIKEIHERNKQIWHGIAERFFYRLHDATNVELAEKFNVTPGKIADWKKGEKPIPDAIIDSECRKHGISKRWVLCGELPWLCSMIEEYGNKLLQLQQEKYPGKEGLTALLLKLGMSNKQWRDYTTGNIAGGIPSKTEQVRLAEAFEVEPTDLFGDTIDKSLIPDTLYPTQEEAEVVRKWLRRYPDEINPLLLEYLRDIVAVQGLCNLLAARLLGEPALGMLEQLAGLKGQLLAFLRALENVVVHARNQDQKEDQKKA